MMRLAPVSHVLSFARVADALSVGPCEFGHIDPGQVGAFLPPPGGRGSRRYLCPPLPPRFHPHNGHSHTAHNRQHGARTWGSFSRAPFRRVAWPA